MTTLEEYEELLVQILRKPKHLSPDFAALREISRWARREAEKLAARGSRSERLESIGAAFVESGWNVAVLPNDISLRVCGKVFRR